MLACLLDYFYEAGAVVLALTLRKVVSVLASYSTSLMCGCAEGFAPNSLKHTPQTKCEEPANRVRVQSLGYRVRSILRVGPLAWDARHPHATCPACASAVTPVTLLAIAARERRCLLGVPPRNNRDEACGTTDRETKKKESARQCRIANTKP
ncbi:hypothetical protein BDU57DRAFT_248855 [Ampelomyces quisqualis]|uniref:Uncharacterized protein n=1 Tax=Ampelomyces quisqualis TaxID=50730 RepID=A0A6A5QND5_AMPQU|nr:hypothetical protein BDU57DRAFT_248855 [Ampelomyces quisqualis]